MVTLSDDPSAAGNSERPLLNTGDEPRVILAAVDVSPATQRVISMAARFARAFPQATLHVLHVLRLSRLERPHGEPTHVSSEAIDDAKNHLEHHKRLAISQCKNAVISHFAVGDPTTEILRVCSELKTDLLVIATHDHAGLERLLLGSIAETLVRRAPCTVTVVRPAPHYG